MHFFLPPLLTIPMKKKEKKNRNKLHKYFLNENKHMKEWNPPKSTKQDRNNTTMLSHHPYILCHFANYALDMNISQCTTPSHTSTRHSTALCSIGIITELTDSAPHVHSTCSFWIQDRSYRGICHTQPQHNSLSMYHNMHALHTQH